MIGRGQLRALAGATLLTCAACASAQTPIVRFFFDTKGAGEQESRTDAGADVLSFANPLVDGSHGETFRFYLYGEFLAADQTWVGIDLDICALGPGEIASWNIYNTNTAAGIRWNTVNNKSGTHVPCVMSTRTPAIFTPGMFNTATASQVDFNHFRTGAQDGGSPFGTTLLGYIDVRHYDSSNDPVEIFLDVAPFGIARLGGSPNDYVAFGFGDAPVKAGDDYARSTLADATVTFHCEPCDANCDGTVNPFDITPMIDILGGVVPAPCSFCAGDTNGDGSLNPFDIQPFLNCLLG